METEMKRMAFGLLFAAATFVQQAFAGDVGIKTIRVDDPVRARNFETLIWYPAAAGGKEENVGGNPLFVGVPALRDAHISDGKYPLIVLSHGSGGNAANLAWLASALAADGFMVAAPNHPGTTSGDSQPKETVKIWNRPMDLSVLLTQILGNAEIGPHVNESQVGLAGFSLGGHAVLSAAGAVADADAYARYCDTNRQPLSECGWLAKGGVDLHKLDKARFNQSNFDARFSFVVGIDPALVQAYQNDSIVGMKIPALIINLAQRDNIPRAVDSSQLVKLLPDARYHIIEDAAHFSFLGVCKPNGKQILADEGETDPLCDDGGGRPREAIHQEIVSEALRFLKQRVVN
jgi:predicted dienelactone hydrolase